MRPPRIVGAALLGLILLPPAGLAGEEFLVLCYHDVLDLGVPDPGSEMIGLETDHLITHFEWLRAHGYRPVGVDDLLAARKGKPLPAGAILLTVDDGLRSLYTRIFPLLKLYGYPVVASLTGAWLDAPPGTEVEYDGTTRSRDDFVSWSELREMTASGLVEVASHSYDLHRGILGNPQGNLQPAAVTRRFDPAGGTYESDGEYRERIRQDLRRNSRLLEEHLGRPPRVIAWPYGEYSRIGEEIARELGMPVSLALTDGINRVEDLSGLHRLHFQDVPPLGEFVGRLANLERLHPIRVAQVDLDYIYDPDPAQTERNLGQLLDRMLAMGVSTVYLQAFADPDGDGVASELYFPNRHLPMRADLLNRVTWQLRTRVGVKVFGWLPVLNFQRPDLEQDRLSMFQPEARRLIGDLYEDMARSAALAGVLFHDDAVLDSQAVPPELAGEDPAAARRRTLALCDWTDELTRRVRLHRPTARTARNLFARAVLEPASEVWLGQALEPFLGRYDQVALMAMPRLEGAPRPDRWLRELLDEVKRRPGALDRTVFELQSHDWSRRRPIPTETLVRQMRLLQRRGAVHLGYYPDDFLRDNPRLDLLRQAISVASFPYPRR